MSTIKTCSVLASLKLSLKTHTYFSRKAPRNETNADIQACPIAQATWAIPQAWDPLSTNALHSDCRQERLALPLRIRGPAHALWQTGGAARKNVRLQAHTWNETPPNLWFPPKVLKSDSLIQLIRRTLHQCPVE
jgi:hypothetical protein